VITIANEELLLCLLRIREAYGHATPAVREGWPLSAPLELVQVLRGCLDGLFDGEAAKQALRHEHRRPFLSEHRQEIVEDALSNLSRRSIPSEADCNWAGYLVTVLRMAIVDAIRREERTSQSRRRETMPELLPDTLASARQDESWALTELPGLSAFVERPVAASARSGNRHVERFGGLCELFQGAVTWEQLVLRELARLERPDTPENRRLARQAIQTGQTAVRRATLTELERLIARRQLALQGDLSSDSRARLRADLTRYQLWTRLILAYLRERSVKRVENRQLGLLEVSQTTTEPQEQMEQSGKSSGQMDRRLHRLYEQVTAQLRNSGALAPDLVATSEPWVTAVPGADPEQGDGSAAERWDLDPAESWAVVEAIIPPLPTLPFQHFWLQSGESWAVELVPNRRRAGAVRVIQSGSRFEESSDGRFRFGFGDDPQFAALFYANGAGLLVGTRTRQLVLQTFVRRLSIGPPLFSTGGETALAKVEDDLLRDHLVRLSQAGPIAQLESAALALRYHGVIRPEEAVAHLPSGWADALPGAIGAALSELRRDGDAVAASVDSEDAGWCSLATGLLWRRETLEALTDVALLMATEHDGDEVDACDEELRVLVVALPQWEGPRLHHALVAAAFDWMARRDDGVCVPWWLAPVIDEQA
jgi:hypothetical protein